MKPGPSTSKTVKELFLPETVPPKTSASRIVLEVDAESGLLWRDGCVGPKVDEGLLRHLRGRRRLSVLAAAPTATGLPARREAPASGARRRGRGRRTSTAAASIRSGARGARRSPRRGTARSRRRRRRHAIRCSARPARRCPPTRGDPAALAAAAPDPAAWTATLRASRSSRRRRPRPARRAGPCAPADDPRHGAAPHRAGHPCRGRG